MPHTAQAVTPNPRSSPSYCVTPTLSVAGFFFLSSSPRDLAPTPLSNTLPSVASGFHLPACLSAEQIPASGLPRQVGAGG